jgi:dnd system-associated protein 4
MADARVKIAKDKADLVKSLKADGADDTTKPFQTYADVLVFAAALGAKRDLRQPFGEFSKKDPDPIPYDVFRKYDKVVKLLAVVATKNPRILADNEEAEESRIKILEEYANAGLEILSSNLVGSVDHLERILLLLSDEKESSDTLKNEDGFDLSYFLNT